ncbi:MAG: TolC family protein [Chitinophagaceae bacterium]|nr:TolC family protein [Chitinophagaceae bacterium]MBL0272666.1 TolC family protein [Chitinophagaceae bacterium]
MRKAGNNLWVLLLFMALSATTVKAQQLYTITAKEAVDIAFKNVTELKNAKLDYRIAEARNKEIIGLALPQVSASIQGNHYLTLPLIQFPDATETSIYDVLKKEGVKDGSGNTITSGGEFKVRNFSFFSPYNLQMGATVQQLLFEPQVFVGLEARRSLLESGELQIKVAEDKVREAVYKNYYAALIGEKQLVFVQESLKRLQQLSHDMDIMYQNGFVEKLDIDKATVSLNNTQAVENQLKNGIAIGYAVLKMTLGLAQADTLVLKDNLTTMQIKDGILEENFSYDNRNEIKLLNKAKQLQGFDIRRYKLSYYPTVAAFYSFQETGQRNSASMNANTSPWFWYNTNQVGISVNVSLFDGLQKKYKIQQSRFALEKIENTIDQTKKGIDLEKTVAKNNLVNAILTMDMQEDNMKLAEKIYNSEKKKYEVGTGSSFSILRSDTDLQQAQSNYFKALYDAVIAKVSYLKALGKL